jgi:nucleoside-diphosphate-sugar epimerase
MKINKTKKICIIGGCGYIGSVLTKEFLRFGHKIVIIDSLRRGSEGVIQYKGTPYFTLLNTDFLNGLLPIILESYDIDIVIHLAAIVGDPACAAEPELATKTNVDGVKYVVDCCNEAEVDKLFFASTSSIYGSNPDICTEKTDPKPLSHYANTKLEAERIIRKESKNGIIFRFATMFGWSPNMRYDLIINRLVHDIVKNSGKFNIFDGKQFRPFLHPKDLAIFFLKIIDEDLSKYRGEIFNLVSENLSMYELGQLLERVIPYSQMNLVSEKEDERSYMCRCFKAYNELGFQPNIRVRDGIQEIEEMMKDGL